MEIEREFMEAAKIVKYAIMKERMIQYYRDLLQFVPSIESPEEKFERQIRQMTIENVEKLAQNAWLDEVESLEC